MPTITPDQGLSLPAGPDAASNMVAFANFAAGVEQRLVRLYANDAARTANRATVAENEVSALGTENRLDVYDGVRDVSLYTRSVYSRIRLALAQGLTPSSTVLQNVTSMTVPLPATAGTIFRWRSVIYYDASAAADFKFAYTAPAGTTMRWSIHALNTAATGSVYATATASGTSVTIGANGVGTVLPAYLEGDITMGGTAGNLQLQAAQNVADATAVNVFERSVMEVWQTN